MKSKNQTMLHEAYLAVHFFIGSPGVINIHQSIENFEINTTTNSVGISYLF